MSGLPRNTPESSLARRLLGWLLYRLAKLGCDLQPYYVVREGGISLPPTFALDPRFSAGFVGLEDTPELVRVEPGITSEQCVDRFQRGLLCYAVKESHRVVGKMWCDLVEFNFQPSFRKLDSHEAYLFHAYVDPAVRGHNLAPFMRQECYAALREMGRDRLYSYTDYFNVASQRFKQKLGAKHESLRLRVLLFGRLSRTITLRRYLAD